jgi:outer membrane murein-binding lipoprotein Lpp
MKTFGKLATGVAAVALLGVVNVGCSTQREVKDTWTEASTRSSQSASRAEDAARRAEAAAARVEAASKRCEDAAARIEAMTTKSMRK